MLDGAAAAAARSGQAHRSGRALATRALARRRPFIGDWREGEKLAQNGRGMTWTDASAAPKDNGGNCYNCHQIDKKEISFGTIGPSLWNYGKLRGVSDVADAGVGADRPIHLGQAVEQQGLQRPAPNMPRFGHMPACSTKTSCGT